MQIDLDGRTVFLADQGKGIDPGRPSVLFLHGAGMDHSVWPLQARHFAYRGWNALAIDLPGHGRAAALDDGAPLLESIPAMADWLLGLIDRLAIRPVHMVGHSMGSLIALEAASRASGRIAGVALLGAAARMPVHPALLEAAAQPAPLAPAMICDWGFGPSGHFGGHRAPGSWMLGHAMKLLGEAAGPRLHTDLAACNDYRAGPDAAARVPCPALVLSARLDRMTPWKAGAKLAEALPDGRLVVLEDTGHMMMVEQPDLTLDALTDFLVADRAADG